MGSVPSALSSSSSSSSPSPTLILSSPSNTRCSAPYPYPYPNPNPKIGMAQGRKQTSEQITLEYGVYRVESDEKKMHFDARHPSRHPSIVERDRSCMQGLQVLVLVQPSSQLPPRQALSGLLGVLAPDCLSMSDIHPSCCPVFPLACFL
ncbi:hypothetical protein CGRA01v4_14112 [Colletotrichum graminicola]|nr:hypothetical protein CGRA01v4_14112 [Colletotrichum graminicola]